MLTLSLLRVINVKFKTLTHSPTHLLTQSVTHSLTPALTDWLNHWLTHSLTYPIIHSPTQPNTSLAQLPRYSLNTHLMAHSLNTQNNNHKSTHIRIHWSPPPHNHSTYCDIVTCFAHVSKIILQHNPHGARYRPHGELLHLFLYLDFLIITATYWASSCVLSSSWSLVLLICLNQ